MNRKINLTLFILPLLLFGCKSKSIYDTEKLNLNGSIKLIREFTSERFGSIGDKTKEKHCEKDLQFDKNGNCTGEVYYLPPCDSLRRIRNYYNDKDLLIRKDEYTTSRFVGKNIYLHDSLGRVIESLAYDNNENLRGKVTYEYDKNGLLQRERSFNEPGNSLWTTTTYRYDSTGKLKDWLSIRFDGLFYGRTSFKYDQNNNMIEEITYQDSSTVRHKHNLTYNEKGIVIEETLTNLDNYLDFKMEVLEVAYDKRNNWIKKVCKNQDSTYCILTREIEYY